MISFPCCKKEKIMVYEGSKGHSSNKCPNCGKYAVFDFDKMTATESEVLRGAVHRFKSKQDISLSRQGFEVKHR